MWCCQTPPKSIYLDRHRSCGAPRSDWLERYVARRETPAIFWRGIRRSLRHLGASRRCFRPCSGGSADRGAIKIGYSMALTGGLAPNGRSALLAQKIWEEDTNAKSGLLGRPVKLIHYDDQTNPATVPGIYTKLLDIDKVDLIIGGYGTSLLELALPIAMQRKKVSIGLIGTAVNSTFNYPNYFGMIRPARTRSHHTPKSSSTWRCGRIRSRRPSRSSRPTRGTACMPRKERARMSKRPASPSSMIADIHRQPPTSCRWCGRLRRRIRTSSSLLLSAQSVGMVRAVNEAASSRK